MDVEPRARGKRFLKRKSSHVDSRKSAIIQKSSKRITSLCLKKPSESPEERESRIPIMSANLPRLGVSFR